MVKKKNLLFKQYNQPKSFKTSCGMLTKPCIVNPYQGPISHPIRSKKPPISPWEREHLKEMYLLSLDFYFNISRCNSNQNLQKLLFYIAWLKVSSLCHTHSPHTSCLVLSKIISKHTKTNYPHSLSWSLVHTYQSKCICHNRHVWFWYIKCRRESGGGVLFFSAIWV